MSLQNRFDWAKHLYRQMSLNAFPPDNQAKEKTPNRREQDPSFRFGMTISRGFL